MGFTVSPSDWIKITVAVHVVNLVPSAQAETGVDVKKRRYNSIYDQRI